MSKSNELDLVCITTPKCVYVSKRDRVSSTYGSDLTHYLINGELRKESFKKSWIICDSVPSKIEKKVSGKDVNHRYELIDESMECEKFPLVFKREDVAAYDEDEYYWYWKKEYANLRSLYVEKKDREPDTTNEVAFNVETILELNEDLKPHSFEHKGAKPQYQLLDKIMFPSIYYESNCSTKLSSKGLYDIIRNYLKVNIDNVNAQITSDYNFCFTVEKRVHLAETKITRTEIKKSNNRSYAKPRFKTNSTNYTKSFKIFSMTSKADNYKGYPVLPELYASNTEELNNKITKILENLMEQINSKVEVCSHCGGTGIVDNNINTINLNELIHGGE